MQIPRSINALALMAAVSFGTVVTGAVSAPASAQPQCASNQNMWHVHRRLDGAIDQLQHDDRDYGGHRVAAINELSTARQQLVAAEQISVQHGENPQCFRAGGPEGGSDVPWGIRAQGGSNGDIWHVRAWVNALIAQLNRDRHDYAGHRVAAINSLEAARNEMLAAERFARGH